MEMTPDNNRIDAMIPKEHTSLVLIEIPLDLFCFLLSLKPDFIHICSIFASPESLII